jgi:hypothetical protein
MTPMDADDTEIEPLSADICVICGSVFPQDQAMHLLSLDRETALISSSSPRFDYSRTNPSRLGDFFLSVTRILFRMTPLIALQL